MKKSTKTIKKGSTLGAALGAAAAAPLGPVGMIGGAALGSKIGGKQKKESPAPATAPEPVQNSKKKKPVQKFIPLAPLAAGAIGGKLLGLQEEEQVPVQKIVGGLLASRGVGGKQGGEEAVQKFLPAIAAPLAVGAIGGKLLGLSKKNDVPVQKIIGGLISSLGQAAGGAVSSLGLSKDDSAEIEKHRGKSFHSHKRKNPLLRRNR